MQRQCLLCRRPPLRLPCFCCLQFYCAQHATAHDALCAQILTAVHCLTNHAQKQYEELAFVSQQFYRFRQSAELLAALEAQRRFISTQFSAKTLALAQIDFIIDKCALVSMGRAGEHLYGRFQEQFKERDKDLTIAAAGDPADAALIPLLTAVGESQSDRPWRQSRAARASSCGSHQKTTFTQAAALRQANAAELAYYRHYGAILRRTAIAGEGQTHYQQLIQLNSVNYALFKADLTGARRLAGVNKFDERLPELLRLFTRLQITGEAQGTELLDERSLEALVKFRVDESALFVAIFLSFHRFAVFLNSGVMLQRAVRSQIHRAYVIFNEVMHKVADTGAGHHVRVAFLAFSWLFCKTIIDPQRLQKVAFRALSFAAQLKDLFVAEGEAENKQQKRRTPVCLIYNEFYDTFELLSTLEDCFIQLDIDAKIQDLTAYFDSAKDVAQRQEAFEATTSLIGSRIGQQAAELLQECHQVDTMLRLALQDAGAGAPLLAETDL